MNAQESAVAKQTKDLLYQALETEMGGVEVYRVALLCARRDELKEEWTRFLGQTERHVSIVREVFERLGLDPQATTPGRQIVRDKARGLVSAMQRALKDAPQAAQIVAAECVVDAETKDRSNWELLAALSDKASGDARMALVDACEQVAQEEDEHLSSARAWSRQLWSEAIGVESGGSAVAPGRGEEPRKAEAQPPKETRRPPRRAAPVRESRPRKLTVIRKGGRGR